MKLMKFRKKKNVILEKTGIKNSTWTGLKLFNGKSGDADSSLITSLIYQKTRWKEDSKANFCGVGKPQLRKRREKTRRLERVQKKTMVYDV